MRWTTLRKTILTASAIAGVVSGLQTLGGRPIVPSGEVGLGWSEHRVPGGRRLDFGVDLGTVDASVVLDIVAPARVDSVGARFGERPTLVIKKRVSLDGRHWVLRIPTPARDDTTLGMTRWVSAETLSVSLRGASLGPAGATTVRDWRIATKDQQDSMRMAQTRDALWWIYLIVLILAVAGAATSVLWSEKATFNTESVIRELIDLVEGDGRADTGRLRQYLVYMVVDQVGYRRAIERLGLSSFARSRSVAKRALDRFRDVATPLRNQLDDALRRLEQETGVP